MTVTCSAPGSGPSTNPSSDRVFVCNTILRCGEERFDLDLLDDEDPFEIDAQAAHLFKHPNLGIDDIHDVLVSDPLFYPATPPAHWLMCARSQAECWSFRWRQRGAATRGAVAQSAATRHPQVLPATTDETDEHPDDPRRGTRVLRPA